MIRHADYASKPAAPSPWLLLYELRSAVELANMARMLMRLSIAKTTIPAPVLQAGAGSTRAESPVIVLPGFGGNDVFTLPLRHYLYRLGYYAEGWGLGTNNAGLDIPLPHALKDLSAGWRLAPKPDYRGEAAVCYLCDRFAARVRQRYQALGRPLTLVGWSLGGYIAREVARDLPDLIERVITLGTPVIGGPKFTLVAGYFRRRGMDLDWIEQEILKREARPITQPITAIYSKTDAVVGWQAAIDRFNPHVRHIEVNTSHSGIVFNPNVWVQVVAALNRRTRRLY